MIYYYIYKITCLCGSFKNHYYLGRHKTKKLNDGYAGSGVKINKYYDKYGKIENKTYIKEILAFYNNDEELTKAEKNFIDDKYITDPMCLNLCEGGLNISGYSFSKKQKEKISKSVKKFFNDNEILRKKLSDINKDKIIITNLIPNKYLIKYKLNVNDIFDSKNSLSKHCGLSMHQIWNWKRKKYIEELL